MRWLGLVVVLTGCQGILGIHDTSQRQAADGAMDTPDATVIVIDAAVPAADGPLPDAPDARLLDAPLPADAHLADATPDARTADASPPDAAGTCETSLDCKDDSLPFCDGVVCRTCDRPSQCQTRAAAIGDGRDKCDSAGRCVACLSNDDCGGPTPYCNGGLGECIAPELTACGSANTSDGMLATAPLAAYDPIGSFTVEAWIFPLSSSDVAGAIVAHTTTEIRNYPFSWNLYLLGSGKLGFAVTSPASEVEANDPDAIPLNAWTHVAGTFDSVNHTIILWVNGVKKRTTAVGFTRVDSISGPLTMGNYADPDPEDQFLGLIDEVRLSNGLSYTTDFLPERHFAAAREEDLALFHFDEGSGFIAVDWSPQANDAVYSGGAALDTRCQYYRCGSLVTYGGDVVTNDAPSLTPGGPFTLEAYVFPVDLAGGGAVDGSIINIVTRAMSNNGPYSYHMFVWTDGLRPAFEVSCNGSDWVTATAPGSTPPLPIDRWTHLAGVFDPAGQRIALFRDGVLVQQVVLDVSCVMSYDSKQPLVVAGPYHGFGRFHGFVDELRLSSVARYSMNFANQVYGMPALEFTTIEDSLALYHYADQGTVAQDSSVENNDGDLEGSVGFDTRCF